MKKILLLSASLAMTLAPMSARELSPADAFSRLGADRAMKSAGLGGGATHRLMSTVMTENGSVAYYVFSAGDKTLFVSGDDAGVPLLGYIEKADADLSNMPPQMKWWLEQYGRQIQWASERGITSRTGGAKSDFAPIAPLCATTWDQDAPYNDLCPKKGSRKTVTGCVATAMAQVMKYYNWPSKGSGTVSYRWNNQTLSMNLGATTFDWGNMLDSYPTSTSGTAAQRTAVATLMKACGYSVEMEYNTASGGGSGASSYGLANVLVENFGYDKCARMEWRDFYALDDWNEMIYENLVEYGPLLYGGSGSGGGHEFVCDGYRSGGLFHINWGWSGYYDGYFKLDALDPEGLGTGGGTGGFNYYQDVTLAIRKPQAGSEYPAPYLGVDGTLAATIINGRYVTLNAGTDGGFFNLGNYSGQFHIGLQLTAENGGDVYYVNLDGMGSMCIAIPSLQGWGNLGFDVPESVPGGTYKAAPVYQLDGVGDWIPFRTYYYSPSYVTLTFASTGIDEIKAEDEAAETSWYNLQGQPVDGFNLPSGVYLKRDGGKVSKVLVK